MKSPLKRSTVGKHIECKFCRRSVWLDTIHRRVYEIVGDQLHADNCERRKAFFKAQAIDAAETRRQKR